MQGNILRYGYGQNGSVYADLGRNIPVWERSGRSFHFNSYRYGYNGKEKEIEISEGDLDFGARIYSSELGRWLSCDPLQTKLPAVSPYVFCINNPNYIYDPDGKFGVPIHQKILEEVMASSKVKSLLAKTKKTDIENNLNNAIIGEMLADIPGALDDNHFDNRFTLDAVNVRWNELNMFIGGLKLNSKNSITGELFGIALHNVQDFYAHSNYIEVYIDYLLSTGVKAENISIDAIPTYDDVQYNHEFQKFAEGKLHTGEFKTGRWLLGKLPWVKKASETSDNEHHDDVNKDEYGKGRSDVKYKGTKFSLHYAAKYIAKKHTQKIVEQKITDEGE